MLFESFLTTISAFMFTEHSSFTRTHTLMAQCQRFGFSVLLKDTSICELQGQGSNQGYSNQWTTALPSELKPKVNDLKIKERDWYQSSSLPLFPFHNREMVTLDCVCFAPEDLLSFSGKILFFWDSGRIDWRMYFFFFLFDLFTF